MLLLQIEFDSNTPVSNLDDALSCQCELGKFREWKIFWESVELDRKKALAEQVRCGGILQAVQAPSKDKATAFLQRQFRHFGHPDVVPAIRALADAAQTDDPHPLVLLGNILKSNAGWTIRSEAARALGQMGGETAAQLLLRIGPLRSPEEGEIFTALAEIGKRVENTRERIAQHLLSRLHTYQYSWHSPVIPISAMRALRALGPTHANSQTTLEKYLDSACPLQKKIAERSLKELGVLPASQLDDSCAAACNTTPQKDVALAASPNVGASTREMDEAIQVSDQSAVELTQGHLHEALLRKKVDARNGNGVAIARLTYCSPQIKQHIMTAKRLQPHFSRVRDAGCEVSPEWASRALFLMPISRSQIEDEDIHLEGHNIILLSEDVELVNDVLREFPKRSRRVAKVKLTHCADQRLAPSASRSNATRAAEAAPSANSGVPTDDELHQLSSSAANAAIALVIERTFLRFPSPSLERSESSTVIRSAPANTSAANEDDNTCLRFIE